MKMAFILPVILVAAACAKQPDNIAAAEVGDGQYRGYSCSQLADVKIKYNHALTNLSAKQKNAASGDAIGVILLGLPISSMAGSDQETAIAVTKGHIQSIERERARKRCG